MHFQDLESKGDEISGASWALQLGNAKLRARVYSFCSASPPRPLTAAFLLFSSLCKHALPAVPQRVKGYPTAPRVLCSQFERTVESENLAELVSGTCLVQVTHSWGAWWSTPVSQALPPGGRHPQRVWLGCGWRSGPPSPAGRSVSLGFRSLLPAPLPSRTLSSGWDHLPVPGPRHPALSQASLLQIAQ